MVSLNDPTFVTSCDTFDTRVEPTTTQDILVALIMHPSSGDHGMSLFDELVYTSLFWEVEEVEGGLNQIQPALRDAKVHLQSISDYTTTSPIGTATTNNNLKSNMKTELTNTINKLDLGETSCAFTSKMGEGRDGPSHCPLPKVLVRSEEESLQLNITQSNKEYLPIVVLPEEIPIESRKELTAMPRLDIGLIHRSIWAIAMDIKDGKSSLFQNYKCLRMLTESAVIILLDRGYTYHEIYSHISLKCTALLKLKSASAISNIFKIVSGLMPKDSANLLNTLRQRRWQAQLRSLLQRIASVPPSPQEQVQAISISQPQSLTSLEVPSLPSAEEAPVYHEEDSYEDDEIDPLLLEDYVLLELEQGAMIVSYSEELVEFPVTIVSNDLEHGPAILLETVETPSIIPVSSSSSPSPTYSLVPRKGEGRVLTSSPTAEAKSSPPPHATVAAGWEARMGLSNLVQLSSPRLISDDFTPTEVISLPPLQLTLAAWWEGWKRSSTSFQTQSNKSRAKPHPSYQVAIMAAWWEGWKNSTTTFQRVSTTRANQHPSHQVVTLAPWWEGWKVQLFSCSSCTILFYLLLIYYTLLNLCYIVCLLCVI